MKPQRKRLARVARELEKPRMAASVPRENVVINEVPSKLATRKIIWDKQNQEMGPCTGMRVWVFLPACRYTVD